MHLEPVKEDVSDKVNELSKSIVETCVPGGVSAIKILESLVGIPIQKRRETLIFDMCEAINKILKKGFSLEQLQQDENFTDFLLQAVKVASMTFKEEKRSALKNAIYNSATLDNAPVFELQQIFLNYIDFFNVSHLKLLYFLMSPRDWFTKKRQNIPRIGLGGIVTLRAALIHAYPELEKEVDLVNSLWTDLHNKGLLDADKNILDLTPRLPSRRAKMDMLVPEMDILESQTTSLGRQLVIFISE